MTVIPLKEYSVFQQPSLSSLLTDHLDVVLLYSVRDLGNYVVEISGHSFEFFFPNEIIPHVLLLVFVHVDAVEADVTWGTSHLHSLIWIRPYGIYPS